MVTSWKISRLRPDAGDVHRCRDCRRWRGGLLCGAQSAPQGHQVLDRLQGAGRQERRVAVRRQSGDLRPRLLGNTEENARNTAEFLIKYHNQFLIDQNWARRCGQWIENIYYPELEEAGLYFRRDDAGQVVTSPGKIRSVAANVQGNSGVPFMDLRRKQVIKAGIPRLEETVATALLRKPDGSVGGVFCLNIITGEYHRRARRAPSSSPPAIPTGCTRARPERAKCRPTASRWRGASARRWSTWKCSGGTPTTSPIRRSWQRMQVYPNPMLGSEKSARMVNSAGEEFFNQQQDDPLAFGPYTVQLKALAKQVHAGKARYDGGYYAGFDHCDAAEVDAYTTYGKTFRQLGLRFPEQLVETAVTSHYRQGGIDVDTETMRSSVPGLYVAGGLGGHSNGLIALATYDGKVVADGVARDLPALSAAAPVRTGDRAREPPARRPAQTRQATARRRSR